jgi:hypothetical protein
LIPAFPRPLTVEGGFAMTASSRVQTTNLAIVHFVLKGINVNGSPPSLVANFLEPYFSDHERLLYEVVVFDLETQAKETTHVAAMDRLAKKLVE